MSNPTQVGSERTEQVLGCIRGHMAKYGHAPTLREISRATGIRSTSTVNYYIDKLVNRGDLARGTACASRSLIVPDAMVVFIGEEIPVEVGGEVVHGRVVEPVRTVAKAA